ncbi:hypothetical protein K9M79_06790 [Candidatus Woesearchaeota archaeon]|nr:hypothetical protein [Candidatus Woesearchaeota archaeon]
MQQSEFKSYLFSEAEGKSKKMATEYLINMVAYPDKGSEFDRNLPNAVKYALRVPGLRKIASRFVFPKMLESGIDSMIIENHKGIAAHCAFEVKPDETVHVFSYGVQPRYQNASLATRVNEDMIHTMADKGYSWFKIGDGGHESNMPIKAKILSQNPNYHNQDSTWIRTPARR